MAVLGHMHELAARLARACWHLRSGAAHGADSAFEAGAGGRCTVYVPRPRYNNRVGAHVVAMDDEMYARLAPDRRRVAAHSTVSERRRPVRA